MPQLVEVCYVDEKERYPQKALGIYVSTLVVIISHVSLFQRKNLRSELLIDVSFECYNLSFDCIDGRSE